MTEPLPIIGPDGAVLGYTDPNDPGWAEFFAEQTDGAVVSRYNEEPQ